MTLTSDWKVITKKHDYENDITIPAVVKSLAKDVDRIVCEMGGNSKADYDHARLIASSPMMLKGLQRAEQTLRNLAANLEGDLEVLARNEAINLRDDIAKAEGE